MAVTLLQKVLEEFSMQAVRIDRLVESPAVISQCCICLCVYNTHLPNVWFLHDGTSNFWGDTKIGANIQKILSAPLGSASSGQQEPPCQRQLQGKRCQRSLHSEHRMCCVLQYLLFSWSEQSISMRSCIPRSHCWDSGFCEC